MTALGGLAPWLGPVLLASLAARVFAGEPDAPLLALLAVVAPLVALCRPRDDAPVDRVVALIAAPGLAAVLWANLLVVVELARLHGIDRVPTLAAALLLALTPLVIGGGDETPAGVVSALGIVALLAALAVMGATLGRAPWTAWSQVASRPALVFGERSGWVADGRAASRTTTLTFTEPHRVTAVTAGTFRVVERDTGRPSARDRRLERGESLAFRPGDTLVLEAGARVRFERGKRVPGAPASGVAWAEPRRHAWLRMLLESIGAAVTLVGGALALIVPAATARRGAPATASLPPTSPSRLPASGSLPAPASLLFIALTGVSWGVYAMYAAPELSIGSGPLTAIVQLAPVVEPELAAALVTVVGLGMLALVCAVACGLWQRTREIAAAWSGGRAVIVVVGWLALCAVALGASLRPTDPWAAWLAGVGFLAATWVAPSLAAREPLAARIGAIVGAVTFVAVAVTAAVAGWPVVAAYPALVAAPLAWLTAIVVRRRAEADAPAPGQVAAGARR